MRQAKIDMEAIKRTVRDVFEGRITRRQLAEKSIYEMVFTACAIMHAAHERFLDEDDELTRTLHRTLIRLLIEGAVRPDSERYIWHSSSALAQACLRAGLYESTPGRGGYKPIAIKLPEAIQDIVDQLGATSYILAFLEEADAGPEQDDRWRAEIRGRKGSQGAALEADILQHLISDVAHEFGRAGLIRLLHALADRLA